MLQTFLEAGEAECRVDLASGVLRSGVRLSRLEGSSVTSGVLARDRREVRCRVLSSLALVRVRMPVSSSY